MKRRVLFLCTGKSARSQMAEALLRSQAGKLFEVASAGTKPEGIEKQTLQVLQRSGLNTEGLRPKSRSEFRGQHFDYVITLCDKVHSECANFPNAGANGISAGDFRSKSWDEFAQANSPVMDFVITVCDQVARWTIQPPAPYEGHWH